MSEQMQAVVLTVCRLHHVWSVVLFCFVRVGYIMACSGHLLQKAQMLFHQAVKGLTLTVHAPSSPPSSPSIFAG